MFASRVSRTGLGMVTMLLTSCGALPGATTTTADQGLSETPTSTTIVEDVPATTVAAGGIDVTLRLPSDWTEAVVQANSDDHDVRLQWETSESTLDVALPGEGKYLFWAEAPSSDDRLCFYQAQSDPQRRQADVYDGQTIILDISGEVCE